MQGKEELTSLITEVLKARNASAPGVPLLLKIAPDLTSDDKADIASVVMDKNTREVNPIRESSYFYHQLFDSSQKQIKVSTLFL